MPGDLGAPAQGLGVQEGEDVEGEELGEDRGEVQVLEGHVVLEPVLYKLVLGALALLKDCGKEPLPLGVGP